MPHAFRIPVCHWCVSSALALWLALSVAGCRSAEQHRRDADDEVYRLVLDRRAKLALGEEEFTIEPSQQSLRQRLLRGEVTELEPLSIVDCLEIGAENSRDYQTRKERLYLAALDLTLERWRFSIQENGTLSTFLAGVGDDGGVAGGAGALSFTRLLGTGASIVADIGLGLVHTFSSTSDWNPISNLGFSIKQPLMRGFGQRIVMEPLTQAERDLVYEVRAFERFRRTFAIDVAERYYRLLQFEDAVQNQEHNYENLTRLTIRNQELARAGRLPDLEFGQARQNELRSRVDLLEARERREEQRDDFKLFLGLPIPIDLPLDPAALADLAKEDLSEFRFGEGSAIEFALANRLDHLTALDVVDDTARKVEVAADALRMGLDLEGEVDLFSFEDEPLKYDLDNSIWRLDLKADLPLDRLQERNLYRGSIILHEVARRASEQSGDQIRADLRAELREATTRREGYAIQLAAVDLAERRIESTRLKLEAGRADTRDLLEAEESLLQAQNGATQALIDYTLARLALFRDMELLRVDETGIAIDAALLATLQAEEAPEVQP